MRLRGFITSLTIVISSICTYHLYLTYLAHQIEKEATIHATDPKTGALDFKKKQAYLQKKAAAVVWSPPWGSYTGADIQKGAIGVGIDIKGGNSYIVVADPVASLQRVAAAPYATTFTEVLAQAMQEKKRHPRQSFIDLFCQLLKKKTNKPLYLFFNLDALEGLSNTPEDSAVQAALHQRLKNEEQGCIPVLRERLTNTGVVDVSISARKQGGLQIETPQEGIEELITNQGLLSFHPLETDKGEINKFLAALHNKFPTSKEFITSEQQFKEEHFKEVCSILKNPRIRVILPKGIRPSISRSPHRGEHKIYLLKEGREGIRVKAARVLFQDREYVVSITLDKASAKYFEGLTERCLRQHIAVALDGRVIFAPEVRSVLSDQFYVQGGFSHKDAKDIANILVSGSMPAKLKIVDASFVGPTLGQQAQHQGLTALLIALLLVFLFMLFYYAYAGLIANFALLFNMLFILGALSQLAAALTLPGIAGLVLTIGMSIDANVLISEHIRRELNKGLDMRSAVTKGYNRAYRSIIDSNVTTLLTGVILYSLGAGPIKGFAVTLIIGILSSLFAAVLISRVITESFMAILGPQRLSFGFSFTNNLFTNLQIDFLGKRLFYYLISALFIFTGLALILKDGLNMGVDFTGGHTYTLEFYEPAPLDVVKEAATNTFPGASLEVKTYGSNNVLKVTTNYLLDEDDLKADKKTARALIRDVAKKTGKAYCSNKKALQPNSFTLASTAKIGASVAEDIKKGAWWAVLLALLVMMAYIFISFRQATMALSALIALLHDTLVLLAALAFCKWWGVIYEVDQTFISCILTVIGYSINDTVVIYDQVKENMTGRKGLGEVANTSINETMSRTLITSFTTLIPVAILYLRGGKGLEALAFSLFVGVVAGTYSSICVATPLAYDLDRLQKYLRKQWYAQKR